MIDLAVLEEDFQQKINLVKLHIRNSQVEEGLQILGELEHESAPYYDQLPPELRYLIPYTRGRAHIQYNASEAARVELERALEVAGSNIEAQARTHNLLGVVYFELGQPDLSLKHLLFSSRAIANGVVGDHNFHLSVYQNLANAYWALNDLSHAIAVYKKALRVLKDINSPPKEGPIFWGLSSCYRSMKNYRYARLYTVRAIALYHTIGEPLPEAALHTNLAELMIEEGKLHDAKKSLASAEKLLANVHEPGLLSFVHRYYADVARKEGDLQIALQYAEASILNAETLAKEGQRPISSLFWVDPTRAYAEALQGAAMVYEDLGNTAEADRLFKQALEVIYKTTIEETRKALHLNYAAMLEARGDFQQAAYHYRQAAILPKPNV